MTTDDPHFVVDAILMEILGIETIPEDLQAENSENWDSANHLRLILAIEERFGVSFSIEEIETVSGRRQLIDILAAKKI